MPAEIIDVIALIAEFMFLSIKRREEGAWQSKNVARIEDARSANAPSHGLGSFGKMLSIVSVAPCRAVAHSSASLADLAKMRFIPRRSS